MNMVFEFDEGFESLFYMSHEFLLPSLAFCYYPSGQIKRKRNL